MIKFFKTMFGVPNPHDPLIFAEVFHPRYAQRSVRRLQNFVKLIIELETKEKKND